MKPRRRQRLALIASLLVLAAGGPAAAQGWTASLESGAARAVSGDSIFRDVAALQGAFVRRWGQRVRAGAFAEFRPVLDDSPASSFWYLDLGAKADVVIYRRLFGEVSGAWALRHIGLPDGPSSTRSGLSGSLGLGATIASWSNGGALYFLGRVHTTWAIKSEDFATTDVGVAIGYRRDLGR
jgi:hypothetical protein